MLKLGASSLSLHSWRSPWQPLRFVILTAKDATIFARHAKFVIDYVVLLTPDIA